MGMDKISVKSCALYGKVGTRIEFVAGVTDSTKELAINIVEYMREFMPESDQWELIFGHDNSLHIEAPVSTLKVIRLLYKHFKGEFELVRGTESIRDYVINCHKVSKTLVDSVINILVTDSVTVFNQCMSSIISSLKMECGTKLKNRPTREYLHSINDKYGIIDSEKLENRVDELMASLPMKDMNFNITYGKCRLAIESLIYNISESRSYPPSRLHELVQDWFDFIKNTLKV